MKQKLTLLIFALFTAMGAKADVTVTIVDGTNAPFEYYGTRNTSATPHTFTTNTTSGMEGLVLSAPVIDRSNGWWSTYCLAIKNSVPQTDEDVTFTAPIGYLIKSISMTVQAISSNNSYDVTVYGETTRVTGASAKEYSNISVNASSFSFTINSVSGTVNWLAVRSMTVTIQEAFDPHNVAGRTFTMQCARGYVFYDSQDSRLEGTNNASNASKFAIVSYADNTYLYDVTKSAFVCHTTAATAGGSGNPALESTSDFSKVVKNISFGSTNIDAYPYYVQEDEFGNWLNMDGNPTVYFNTWRNFENGNGGNTYKIEVVDTDFDQTDAAAMLDAYFNPSATVTYVISDAGGVIYTSETFITTVGSIISSLPSDLQRPYCTYNVSSETMVAGANTVNAIVTYAPPFRVSSNFETATWYYATLRGSKYVRADETQKDGSDRYLTSTTNEKTDVYKWAFVGNPYNLAIMNKGAGSTKYLNANNSTAPLMLDATPSSDNKARWIASPNSNGGFSFRNESGANLYINDAGGGGNLGLWNSSAATSDGGSNWVIEEVLPVCNVTYTYTFGNNTYTSTELQNIGDPVSLPLDINFSYTNYTFDIQTVPDAVSAIVNVTVEGFNMPFTVSTDYATATWYYLNAHASYSDRYVSTDGTAVVWSQGKGITDAYQWAFIGNPIEGIKIINKAAGDGIYMMATDPASMGETAKAWTLKQQTNTSWQCGANGFGLYDATLTNLNTQGSTLSYWWSFDQGSTFWVEAVPNNYASNVEAEIKPWFDNYGSNFQLKTSVVEANQATYEAALVNCDLATYEYLLELIADVDNFVYPSTGYYRIKSSGLRIGESYIAYGQPSSATAGLITVTAANAATDASTIIKLTGTNGAYTIATQGMYAQNQTTNNVAFPMTDNAEEAATFYFIPYAPGVAVITNDYTTQGYFHESGWVIPAVVRWTADAAASQWTVEVAETLTISLNGPVDGSYYATLCVPYDCTISGATAYTLALNASQTGLTLSEGTTTIAAGTPVLLKGTSATATLSLASNAAYQATPLTTTALTGIYLAKTVEGGTDYFLGVVNSKVGFYHWDGTKLGANRAYFEASKITGSVTPVKGLVLDFEDNATGIEGLNANLNDAIYNLAGQRLSKIQKGINIVNGKKILK